MKRSGFAGALRMNLKQALGLNALICIVLIAAINLYSVWYDFRYSDAADTSVVYIYNTGVLSENFMESLLPILISAVYATSFLQEVESRFYRFQLTRCSRGEYILAKGIACAISAFLCTWLGLGLFLMIVKIRLPLMVTDDLMFFESVPLNGCELAIHGHPLLYLLNAVTFRSIAMMFWPLCALAASSFVPNRFAVLCAPWIVYYGMGMVDSARSVNYGRRFSQMSFGSLEIARVGTAYVNMTVRYFPLMALCMIIFGMMGERRLKNG